MIRALPMLPFLLASTIHGLAHAATPATADPHEDAFAFAARIGDLEAYAEVCSAPPSTYTEVVKEARSVLPRVYRRVGFRVADIERDVTWGRNTSRLQFAHSTIPGWPPCNAFRRMVSNVCGWIGKAKGRRARPLPPYDTDGWQERVRIEAPISIHCNLP